MQRALVITLSVLLYSLVAAAQEGPFSRQELRLYLQTLPEYADYLRRQGSIVNSTTINQLPLSAISQSVRRYLSSRGWTVERYVYVSGQVGNGMSLLLAEEGTQPSFSRLSREQRNIAADPDIPPEAKGELLIGQSGNKQKQSIPTSEMVLIQANMDQILNVFQAIDRE